MRDCRTCSGDQICHLGAVALDASHVVYLGRGALELSPADAAAASQLVVEMLRATSCWEAGRLWTTTMIRNDQIDQQLAALGLGPSAGMGWDDYLVTYSTIPNDGPRLRTGEGRHDDDLLARVIEAAARHPTLLVTNDEALFELARQRMFEVDGGGLASENSTMTMLRLLGCGAVPEAVVDACLTAEHKNLKQMRRRGMSPEKYDAKRRRLERAGQRLVLRRFGDDWSTDSSSEG